MKKNFLYLITFLFLFTLVGCGKYDEKDILKDFEKKINNVNNYVLKGTLQITNNDDTYQYDVEANYKKDNNYRVSLTNKANNHEQIILKNKEGVYIVTPSLNKSFKFQSEWPNNNSQVYLLQSLLNDIKNDEQRTFEQKDDKYIFTTKVNYPNDNELINQRITMNKNLEIESVEVINKDNIPKMVMKINSIDFKNNFDENFFELNSIIEEINFDNKGNEQPDSDTNNTEKGNNSESSDVEEGLNDDSQSPTEYSSAIDDIIYPLYIPVGTSLVEQEKISKTDGERVILTFDGEKPFLLVEETSSITDEFSIIPTFGEPYLLVDTIGALTDNSITWSSNGMDYYIVSEVMSQVELIEIASSITTIPTIK